MKRIVSAFAVLLLLGAGCPLMSEPAPAAPETQTPPPDQPAPKPGGPSADGCRRTGCSGQICADEDMVSTCEYREEYACYKDAACERQTDGACGWTATAALTACLNASKGGPIPL